LHPNRLAPLVKALDDQGEIEALKRPSELDECSVPHMRKITVLMINANNTCAWRGSGCAETAAAPRQTSARIWAATARMELLPGPC
jgi:hypothetical protein